MDGLAVRLASASVQGGLVILGVWVVCRWGGIPARAAAWLWWGASLRLCLGLLTLPAVSLPLLPSPDRAVERTAPPRAQHAPPASRVEGISPVVSPMIATARGLQRATPLLSGIAVVWAAVLLMQVGGLWRSRRQVGCVRAASRHAGETLRLDVCALARATGLRVVPEIRISDEIQSPQVVGVRHPCVLLPSAVADFPPQERRMALCHELMHVRRRDLLLGWIPALAERLFFFHPLARLAAREYVLAREAACDAAVVRLLHLSPADYARLLVRLGLSRPALSLAVGAASPTTSALRRRIEMLHQPVVSTRSRLGLSMAVLVAALAWVPVEVTTRTVNAANGASVQEGGRSAGRTDALLVTGESPAGPVASSAQAARVPEARFAARSRAAAEASAQDAQASVRALEQEARAEAQAARRAVEQQAQAEAAQAQADARQAREIAATQQGAERLARELRAAQDAARRGAERQRALEEMLAQLEVQGAGQPDSDLESTRRAVEELRRELAAKYTDRHPARVALEQNVRALEAQRKEMETMRSELEARRAELEARRVELEVFERRVVEEVRRYRQAAESALQRNEPPVKD